MSSVLLYVVLLLCELVNSTCVRASDAVIVSRLVTSRMKLRVRIHFALIDPKGERDKYLMDSNDVASS